MTEMEDGMMDAEDSAGGAPAETERDRDDGEVNDEAEAGEEMEEGECSSEEETEPVPEPVKVIISTQFYIVELLLHTAHNQLLLLQLCRWAW